MKKILIQLAGGDFRSIGKSNDVVETVYSDPTLFSDLFSGLIQDDPIIRMRAADAVEKVTAKRPELLQKYKETILSAVANCEQQEVQWHVAQIIPRLQLSNVEAQRAVDILTRYLRLTESNIVRVMSLQSLADLALQGKMDIDKTIDFIDEYKETCNAPSVQARVRKLKKQLERGQKHEHVPN